jgi:hypothetical protein
MRPQAAGMSCYSVAEEITPVCADFLVERRGFELMAIGRCPSSDPNRWRIRHIHGKPCLPRLRSRRSRSARPIFARKARRFDPSGIRIVTAGASSSNRRAFRRNGRQPATASILRAPPSRLSSIVAANAHSLQSLPPAACTGQNHPPEGTGGLSGRVEECSSSQKTENLTGGDQDRRRGYRLCGGERQPCASSPSKPW